MFCKKHKEWLNSFSIRFSKNKTFCLNPHLKNLNSEKSGSVRPSYAPKNPCYPPRSARMIAFPCSRLPFLDRRFKVAVFSVRPRPHRDPPIPDLILIFFIFFPPFTKRACFFVLKKFSTDQRILASLMERGNKTEFPFFPFSENQLRKNQYPSFYSCGFSGNLEQVKEMFVSLSRVPLQQLPHCGRRCRSHG